MLGEGTTRSLFRVKKNKGISGWSTIRLFDKKDSFLSMHDIAGRLDSPGWEEIDLCNIEFEVEKRVLVNTYNILYIVLFILYGKR